MQGATRTLRVAGLDLGTNTCLCLIVDLDLSADGRSIVATRVVRDEVRVVRLGQSVNATRELHPEALLRAEQMLAEFGEFIHEAKCERVLAVATSAARDATNGYRLLELGAKFGIPIEIVSGEKEAELTFVGAIESSWSGVTAVIDVGGGSTELIIGDARGIRSRVSADVGSVRLTEALVSRHPIAGAELEAIRIRVRESLGEAKQKIESSIAGIDHLIGVAGTPTTLAAVDRGEAFESDKIHGHVLTRQSFEHWISNLSKMTIDERIGLAGMEPKRADVIVAGAVCVAEAMRILNQDSLTVSIRGLRYGVAQWVALR